MKLTDLNAELRHPDRKPGDKTLTVPEAWGVNFTCPCRKHDIWAPFQHHTPSGTAWCATGTTLEDLSFIDSPRGSRSIRCNGECKAHFNITHGVLDFYGDSGVQG
jgi:hypothetical protein